MRDDYFISLGAGENQAPLIYEAKAMGLRVIGVDINSQAVGLLHCEIRIQESIYNYRRILSKIQQFVPEGNIIGIACAGYGRGIFSASWIAQHLQLPAPSVSVLEILNNKFKVRELLRASNIQHPLFAQPQFLSLAEKCNKTDVENLGYPIILKPVNGAGKKNIFSAANFSQLKPKLRKSFFAGLNKEPAEMMLEEKIIGDEITACGIVEDKKFHLILLSDKITSAQAPFIELEHHFPSRYQNYEKDITAIHQELIEILGIDKTPVVSEWKIKNGLFYLIEISAQIPGEFFAGFLIPNAKKYNYYQQLVHLACAQKIDKQPKSKHTKIKIQYQPTRINNMQWEQFCKGSAFSKILNPQTSEQFSGIDSNAKRFGVAVFIE